MFYWKGFNRLSSPFPEALKLKLTCLQMLFVTSFCNYNWNAVMFLFGAMEPFLFLLFVIIKILQIMFIKNKTSVVGACRVCTWSVPVGRLWDVLSNYTLIVSFLTVRHSEECARITCTALTDPCSVCRVWGHLCLTFTNPYCTLKCLLQQFLTCRDQICTNIFFPIICLPTCTKNLSNSVLHGALRFVANLNSQIHRGVFNKLHDLNGLHKMLKYLKVFIPKVLLTFNQKKLKNRLK